MLRVLYTVPARYHTSEHDKFTHLAVGAFRPISLPLRSWVGHGPFTTRRAAIVLLGHEGQRTLAAVRRIDPDDMLLVFAKSGDEDLEATCAKQNAQLIERVRSGQCRGETLGLPRLDIQGARSGMGAWLDKFSAAPGCVVSLVPLGPKPLVVAAVLALLERATLTSEVVYPLASRYNPHYSEGTAGTFSVELCLAAPAPQTTWSRPVDWGM